MDTLSLGINFISKLPQGMHSNDNQFSDNSIRNSKSTDVVHFLPEFIPENFRDFTLKEIIVKAKNKFISPSPYPSPTRGEGTVLLHPSLDGRGWGRGNYVILFNAFTIIIIHINGRMKEVIRQDCFLCP
jgi:hypothetical protein